MAKTNWAAPLSYLFVCKAIFGTASSQLLCTFHAYFMGSNLHPFSFFRKELFWMSLLYCILIRQRRELHDLCHRLISDLSCPAHAGCGFFQCKGLIEGSYFLLPLVQCTSFRRGRYTIGIGVPFYGQSGKKKNLLTLSVNVLPFSFFFLSTTVCFMS